MQTFFTTLMVSIFRILPHAPNFAPVGALAILNGRTQSRSKAIASMIIAMIVSDFFIAQIYGYPFLSTISFFVYLGFTAQVVIAAALKNTKFGMIASAILGAVSFYLISNFGVWAFSSMYAKDLNGLYACYLSAVPFFKMTLISNLLWTPILVLGHPWAQKAYQGLKAKLNLNHASEA